MLGNLRAANANGTVPTSVQIRQLFDKDYVCPSTSPKKEKEKKCYFITGVPHLDGYTLRRSVIGITALKARVDSYLTAASAVFEVARQAVSVYRTCTERRANSERGMRDGQRSHCECS